MPSERGDVDAEEYWLLRRAVRDAIWDVLGTVLTLVFAWVLFVVGASVLVSALTNDAGATRVLLAAFGLVLVAGAVVQFMRELRVFPFD